MENEKNIRMLRNSFLALSVFTIVTGCFFVIYLIINGDMVMKNSILSLISQNTFLTEKITNFIFNQINNFNLLDFKFIYTQYLDNLIILESILSLVPLLIIQGLFIVLSKRTVTKDTAFFSAFFIITMLVVVILNLGNYFSVLQYFNAEVLKTKNLIISLINIAQLIIFVAFLKKLSDAGRFNLLRLKEKIVYSNIIKVGAVLTIIFFLATSAILTVANQGVEQIKKDLKVDYTIDIEKKASGIDLLIIPEKLQKDAAKYGINMPATINAADVLSKFDVEKIDLGKYINNFVGERIDNLKYRVINIPLLQSIIIILATIGIYIINMLQRKEVLDYKMFSAIQVAIAITLFIYVGDKFTFLPRIFLALIVIGTILKLTSYVDFAKYKNNLKGRFNKKAE